MRQRKTVLVVLVIALVIFAFAVPVIGVDGCPRSLEYPSMTCGGFTVISYVSITRFFFGLGAVGNPFGYYF